MRVIESSMGLELTLFREPSAGLDLRLGLEKYVCKFGAWEEL